MIRVKKVEYLCEFKLKILFSNGKMKVVDFENWISEDNVYLKPLKDIGFFKKVRLDDCKYSICWPNGADFCPDVLYEAGRELPSRRMISRSKKTQKPKRKSKSRMSRLK